MKFNDKRNPVVVSDCEFRIYMTGAGMSGLIDRRLLRCMPLPRESLPCRRDHHDSFLLLALQRNLCIKAIDFRLDQFLWGSIRSFHIVCGHLLSLFQQFPVVGVGSVYLA